MINGPNMYGYVGGNPILYFDQDGRYFFITITIGAAAGALSGVLKNGWTWENAGKGALKGAVIGAVGFGAGALLGAAGSAAFAGTAATATASGVGFGLNTAAGLAGAGLGLAADAWNDHFNPNGPWNPLTDGLFGLGDAFCPNPAGQSGSE